ncbi:hypothetical protein BDD14_3237 [Edaphobacter modestus]|uniref:Uncharacterized protein n=1 Tax=Edaphobacter modestus TaxID=388466 RepID=A0A4Q7YX96_9BACT|nr:hypothetical protein BDD14_3237 [Edaphobacter modestus]
MLHWNNIENNLPDESAAMHLDRICAHFVWRLEFDSSKNETLQIFFEEEGPAGGFRIERLTTQWQASFSDVWRRIADSNSR